MTVRVRFKKIRSGGAGAVLFFLLISVLFAGCGRDEAPETANAPASALARAQAERVIPFTVGTIDGASFSLEDTKGSVVVLNFWASWCGPCKYEAPSLQKAYETFSPRGVKFIGVAVDDTEKGALAFVERFGLNFPIAIDSTGEIINAYNIYAIPKTYIIGKDGSVAYTHSGAIGYDDLARVITGAM